MSKDDRYAMNEQPRETIGADDKNDTQSSQDKNQSVNSNGHSESTTSLPTAGTAKSIRTGETYHSTPDEFSMSNLPLKQRRTNMTDGRDSKFTVMVQRETAHDIRDAKQELEAELETDIPKMDTYEILLIAGANDDLSMLDAAHIIGYGIK